MGHQARPGDGVRGLDVTLEKANAELQYIQVRHEERVRRWRRSWRRRTRSFTGEVRSCYATSGPGAIHLLNGLCDAKMDHVPVVAIVGKPAPRSGPAISKKGICNPCSRTSPSDVATAGMPGQVRHPIDRAIRIASTRRFVTCVIIRNDLKELKELAYQDTPVARCTHTGVGHAGPAMLPSDTLLREAAAVLNAGKKIGILVGPGALGTADEVIAVAKELRSLEEHSH